MATKTANDAAKKKAAKEKKMLVVLIVFLVLALGYAYKTLTKLHGSSPPEPVAAATTTSSSGTSAPPATSTPPASSSSTSSSSAAVDVPSGATSAPAGSTSSNGADKLVSAVTPPLDQGQLRSFTLFDAKDPFNSEGPKPSGSTAPSVGETTQPSTQQPSSSSGSSSGSGSSSSGSSSSGSKPAVAPPTSAVISVNGSAAVVSVNSVFPVNGDPATDGIFRLVGLTQTTARIAVVGGSYASGATTLTLHVGQPVTLANTADGKRYTLELFPQGTTVAAAPSSTSSPTSTTSTTPTS